jgi:4-diphosphocytidyl-2-C-methyl-D-erythritol kinase
MLQTVTAFAPAKINLALHVLGRRSDGYHELDSVVAFADAGDELTFSAADHTSLEVDGPFAGSVPATADNLVLKACAVLATRFDLPPVAVRLTKNLPVASGIGGGSADAAAALRGYQQFAGIEIENDVMAAIALSLGADVPVCLYGKACRMQGIGERITALRGLPAPAILLVNPMQACSTAQIFNRMGLAVGETHGTAIDLDQPATWRNDMGPAAEAALPVIRDVMSCLQRLPYATVVRMSGSGATCFALFHDIAKAQEGADRMGHTHPHYWTVAARLS